MAFRDLNKNGRLDPYEDPNQPIETRVEDLLSQMTLEEKAGQMFFSMIRMEPWWKGWELWVHFPAERWCWKNTSVT